MKKNVFLFFIVFIYICLTFPSAISFISCGACGPWEIVIATILCAFIFGFITSLANNKLKKRKAIAVVGGIAVVIQLIIAFTVIFSTPDELVLLSLKAQKASKNDITVLSETEVSDDMFIVVYKDESKFYCATVRKNLLTYYTDTEGFRYYWSYDEVDSETLSHNVNVPKAHINEMPAIIYYLALSEDVFKAYIDDNEMSEISLGNIRLAYYLDESRDDYSHKSIKIKKIDSEGNIIYDRKG